MQCYEGLDASAALYEWNYQRQLLAIKAREGSGVSASEIEAQIFSESYLLERPLLAAIRRDVSPVLLIDEVDRADEEFEAFLLELLSDFQVSIPEFGVVTARSIPRVVLTSNGTRELSDALRRRCLYHYLDFPDVDRESAILVRKLPGIDIRLAEQVARMVAMLRKEDLRKVPGVAETLDWAATLAGLGVEDLRQEPEIVHETLIAMLKTHEDRARVSQPSDRTSARQGGVMGALAQLRPDEPPGPGPAMRRRLVGFAQTLRGAGFAIGQREVQDAALLLTTPLGERPERLRAALKALFSSRHADSARFDELFDAFWRGRGAKTMAKITAQGLAARSPRRFETGPGAGRRRERAA